MNILPLVPELWLPIQGPGQLWLPFQHLESSVQPTVQALRQDQLNGERGRGVDLHHPTRPIFPPCLKSVKGQSGLVQLFSG